MIGKREREGRTLMPTTAMKVRPCSSAFSSSGVENLGAEGSCLRARALSEASANTAERAEANTYL